jgi:hypothetical protein
MIWIITACILYALTCGIALFLICTNEVEVSKDSFFDIRNIGVALFWPLVLGGHGIWMAGKRIFNEKPKTQDNVNK